MINEYKNSDKKFNINCVFYNRYFKIIIIFYLVCCDVRLESLLLICSCCLGSCSLYRS